MMKSRTRVSRSYRGLRAAVVIGAAASLVVACSSTNDEPTTPSASDNGSQSPDQGEDQSPEPVDHPKLTFAVQQGGLGDWQAYVADAEGFFDAEGLTVEIQGVQNNADIATSVVGGSAQAGACSIPQVVAAVINGQPMVMAMATQVALPGGEFDNWWAVLPDSDIQSAADLAGKNVDIFAPNTLAQASVRTILEDAGLDVGQYEEISVPFPQAYSATASGQVDIGFFVEPFFTAGNAASMEEFGEPMRVIFTYLDLYKNGANLTGLCVNTEFAQEHPETMKAFVRAMLDAAQWGTDNRDGLLHIIADATKVDFETIADMIPSSMSLDGQFVPGFLDQLQEVMIANEIVPAQKEPLPVDELFDQSYLPAS